MLTCPVRAAPLFAATVRATVPFALPLWPDAIAIQLAPLDALHAQPESVATSTVKRPPDAGALSDVRLSEKRHGAAAWLSGTRSVPTLIVAERCEGAGFALTANGTVALPCPSRVPVSETQLLSVTTLHVQSRAVVTFSAPDPPDDGNGDGAELLTETWQRSTAVGVVPTDVSLELQAIEMEQAATPMSSVAPTSPLRLCIGESRPSGMHGAGQISRAAAQPPIPN